MLQDSKFNININNQLYVKSVHTCLLLPNVIFAYLLSISS